MTPQQLRYHNKVLATKRAAAGVTVCDPADRQMRVAPNADVIAYGQHKLNQCRQRDGIAAKSAESSGVGDSADCVKASNWYALAEQARHSAENRDSNERIQTVQDSAETYKLPTHVLESGHLMAAIDKARFGIPFRIWMLLRLLDAGLMDGSGKPTGWVSAEVARRELSKGGRLAYAKRNTINHHLRQCERIGFLHFSKDRTTIYYRSREKVILMLGLSGLRRWFVTIPVDALLGSFVDFRALCHATWQRGSGDDGTKPISRKARQVETGRCKTTQIKYDRMNGVQTLKNYQYIGSLESAAAWRHARRLMKEDRRVKVLQVYQPEKKRNRLVLAAQLPNSYQPPKTFKTAKFGRMWMNRRLEYLRKKWPSLYGVAGSFGSDVHPRMYHENYKTVDHWREKGAKCAYVATDTLGTMLGGQMYQAV